MDPRDKQNLQGNAAGFAKSGAQKIIIDTDPGVDDALAIILAAESPDIEVLGLTTIYGNADLETTTLNALRIVEMTGQTIPVAKGAAKPWKVPLAPHPDFVHGKDGLGNTYQPMPKGSPIETSAAQFIVDTVKANPGEVSLLGLGGLTNFYDALQLDPSIVSEVKEVVLMGGVLYRPGNVTPVAEANIMEDPHAADAVFTAGWPVTMVGLDVTLSIFLERARLQRYRAENEQYGPFLDDIHQFYIDFYKSREPSFDGCAVHDAAALLYIIDPTLFECREGPIRVVCEGIAMGQTIMAHYDFQWQLEAWAGVRPTTVPLKVDQDRFFELMDRILVKTPG